MELQTIWKVAVHTNRPLLGRVKSIHTERSDLYQQGEHWIEGPRRSEESFSCDSQGRLVERVQYDVDSSICSRTVYTYDSAGNLDEDTFFNASGALEYRTIYTYDSDNTCTLTVYDTVGTICEKVIYRHDSEGKLVQRINYYPDGSVKARWVREVGIGGMVTKECIDYGPDGSITGSRTETHDPSRKELQKCFCNANGSLDSKWVSYYDQGRAEIERRTYNNKAALERKLTWNYDPSGNLTRTMEHSSEGELEEERFFVYEYDQVGNWSKRTFLILVLGSEPPMYRPGPFIYRTISYWPNE